MTASLQTLATDIRLSTPADQHITVVDHTILSAYNTCPVWGITRYGLGKTFANSRRAMPLELGKMCHDAFAALRLLRLQQQLSNTKGNALIEHHAIRLFGKTHGPIVYSSILSSEDIRTKAINVTLDAMDLSNWEDDPDDKFRTKGNADVAMIGYIDNMIEDHWDNPVWIQDINNPASPIGAEIIFDLVLSFDVPSDAPIVLIAPKQCVSHVKMGITRISVRYCGRIDGIEQHNGTWFIEENKTTGRINNAWREGFTMSHQITGYTVAASIYTGLDIQDAYVVGLQIPQPKNNYLDGIVYEPVRRELHNVERWLHWVYHTLELMWHFGDDAINAPRYTHSCNRYFRPCPLIPFCYAEEEEQREILDEMVVDKWSPLNDAGVVDEG